MEQKVIGVYALCNTAAVCVHDIDHSEDKVLASINGENPEWYDMADRPTEGEYGEDGGYESGFMLGEMFIPFSEIMRTA